MKNFVWKKILKITCNSNNLGWNWGNENPVLSSLLNLKENVRFIRKLNKKMYSGILQYATANPDAIQGFMWGMSGLNVSVTPYSKIRRFFLTYPEFFCVYVCKFFYDPSLWYKQCKLNIHYLHFPTAYSEVNKNILYNFFRF